jgi:hypothetical protein
MVVENWKVSLPMDVVDSYRPDGKNSDERKMIQRYLRHLADIVHQNEIFFQMDVVTYIFLP